MKSKKFNKRITLHKQTVANLNNDNMSKVKGGLLTIRITCGEDCNTYFTCEDATVCGACWTLNPTICGTMCTCNC
jgi:putative component of toxin-antitoxin plasmid stabilization module